MKKSIITGLLFISFTAFIHAELVNKDTAVAIARSLVHLDNYDDFLAAAGVGTNQYDADLLRTILIETFELTVTPQKNKPVVLKSPPSKPVSLPDTPKIGTRSIEHDAATAHNEYGLLEEFQYSFKSNELTGSAAHPKLPLISTVPAMGHYRSEQYNFLKRLALIELTSGALREVPLSVAQAVAKQLGFSVKNSQELAQELAKRNTRVAMHIMINGLVIDPKNDSPDKTYNMIFHAWASAVSGSADGKVNVNVPMGIFSPNGLRAGSGDSPISFNQLSPRNVNAHDSDTPLYAVSPNNARFGFEAGRSLATGWSVAAMGNSVTITYHLFVTNEKLETALRTIMRGSKNLPALFVLMHDLEEVVGGADLQALRQAIQTMYDLAVASVAK